MMPSQCSKIAKIDSWAQHADDLMIINIFNLLNVKTPSYIDLGAHHPFEISNTALLYARGSRGINVEANPNLIQAFRFSRPDDINLNVGVAVEPGEMDFHMFDKTSGLNSFSKEEVHRITSGELVINEIVKLPVTTINAIVNQYSGGKFKDLLLTDIEGLDHEVLESADFINLGRPKLIVSEIRPWDSEKTKMMMKQKGYFTYCRMGANLFFVDQDLKGMVL